MDLEKVVEQHTTHIADLTRNVDKLSIMMENSEKNRVSDTDTMKEAVKGINVLNERMAKMLNYADDLAQCKQDVRVAAHDAKTALNTLNALPQLVERITKCEGKIETIETLRDKLDGAGTVLKSMIIIGWVIGGTSFLALIGFLIREYVLKGGPVSGY